MNTFLTGKALEDAIYNIIWETEEILLMISPYIKLDHYFKKLLDKHQQNPKIHLLLVFGKNENEVKRSMSQEDFDYFKKFPNVSIVYVPNLHAKYYGNEKEGVITSINLYDYSFKNNIEFGVHTKYNLLSKFRTTADNEAWDTCMEIAEKNEVVFIKRPLYENKKGILSFGKSYIKSEILHNSTDKFYGGKLNEKTTFKRLQDFPETLEANQKINDRPERMSDEDEKVGFCIRTGKEIKFNPKQPMSKEAWKIWNEYANENFPEKFCHRTGKPSYGKTSMKNPVL